jgi:predicted dehydrogenase/aryl-alcohol dehydrogenase-like predicted oxidoreductase
MGMEKLNWGIIGTGSIAEAFAHGLKQSESGTLAAVGSRTQASAEAFAKSHPGIQCHGSYEHLLEDQAVQAVYISTPHPFHAEWAIKAAEAGKHVLCEKPAALNQWQAQAIIQAARKAGVYFSEAFMYRFHPQTKLLVDLIQSGAIGEVRMIRASFGFGGGDTINPDSRLFNSELGGGGILDVGCYAASAARLVAGAAIGKPFDNPVSVKGGGQVGTTGVDEWAAAVLKFSSGITAQIATAIRASLDNSLVVIGSEGRITVPDPWTADRVNPVAGRILVTRGTGTKEHEIPATKTSFALEADGVAAAVAAGRCEPESPAMTWDDTLGNLAVLDAWRKDVGVLYPQEKPAPRPADLSGKPVRVRKTGLAHQMAFGQIPGLDKPVSKLIFGALTAHNSFAKAQVLFDHWLESGGNTVDTAYVYGNGTCDGILGKWLASRGVREDLVIVAKGAHTPYCTPEGLTRQLHESLDHLQTDYTDIYIMHRDNEDIPVGEFIDVLNEHVAAGRIRVFGGSNWSPERFMEANAYAKANGKQGMAILNNNLSLARMVDPVWPGCLHMSDASSRDWLQQNQIVHFAWSSQARGFFTERTDHELERPGYDHELRRCWISEDNLARRRRCIELAERKGVLPINIAAAYVLSQPFESYALIGPETLREMETSLPALDVTLSSEEIAWLWGDSTAAD